MQYGNFAAGAVFPVLMTYFKAHMTPIAAAAAFALLPLQPAQAQQPTQLIPGASFAAAGAKPMPPSHAPTAKDKIVGGFYASSQGDEILAEKPVLQPAAAQSPYSALKRIKLECVAGGSLRTVLPPVAAAPCSDIDLYIHCGGMISKFPPLGEEV